MDIPIHALVPRSNRSAIEEATRQFDGLFARSRQPMYLFLDDRNKSCNARFAKLLGYHSPEAWAAVTTPFTEAFLHPASRGPLVQAHVGAIRHGVASVVPVTWYRLDGQQVHTRVLLAPVDLDGNRLALHFVEPA
jgi:PAS domain-containing protein